jgi:hypothetical protein
VSALEALAGHAWGWRPVRDFDGDVRPVHLAACSCWRNGGVLPAEDLDVRRRTSLWARLFTYPRPANDLDWNR